jgi:xylulose-5-phosphate/fructose-6-phosphate phosphoketolase
MTQGIAQTADALWRAITYVAVAQLHLDANPLLHEPLTAEHVKQRPSGHWGTVPGTAFVLSHVALLAARAEREVVPVLGAGHAGVAQLALAWLTGDLAAVRPQFTLDLDGLTRLVRSFPDVDGLGAEVSPLLPAGWYLGGQIGGALAFAQGAALDASSRVVVPVLGDGECETPTTAAAWLAVQALGDRSAVVPVVHVNGFRMGARSLLGSMDDDALRAYAAGLGWHACVVRIDAAGAAEHEAFHEVLASATTESSVGHTRVVFLRCVKGWSGPARIAGHRILDTPHAHKTPIIDPCGEPEQLGVLANWLASYAPADLFRTDGTPAGALMDALQRVRGVLRPRPSGPCRPVTPLRKGVRHTSFSEAVRSVVREHAAAGDVRLFSPDELHSNRLGELAHEPWVTEVLAEEVLLG